MLILRSSSKILFFELILCLKLCFCDIYSSAESVKSLVATQSDVLRSLESVLHELDTLSFSLRITLATFREHDDAAQKNPAAYIGNPINSFTIIKRLSLDYEQIGLNMHNTYEKIKYHFRRKDGLVYPTTEDLSGSIMGMFRLINTYQLNHRDLSDGIIGNHQSLPMTSNDCYAFAKELMRNEEYTYAARWFEAAARKFNEHSWFSHADIYLNVADCHKNLGHLRLAFNLYDLMLKEIPASETAITKKKEILEIVEKNSGKWVVEPQKKVGRYIRDDYNITYGALCREELQPELEVHNSLKCFYKHGKHTFLRIAPFKVEVLHPNISLHIFHDVITDEEIQWVKEEARPNLERARVVNETSKRKEPSRVRTAKSAWLKKTSSVVQRLYKRIAHMTDLVSETAEDLQIANYGIGGHYGPHWDYLTMNGTACSSFDKQRIATIMFYGDKDADHELELFKIYAPMHQLTVAHLDSSPSIGSYYWEDYHLVKEWSSIDARDNEYTENVSMGGATVFHNLGVTILPKKGSAAFWLNLYPSGEGNPLTKHEACPVLVGYKWVGNVWLKLAGQMYTAPCNMVHQKKNRFNINNFRKPLRRSHD